MYVVIEYWTDMCESSGLYDVLYVTDSKEKAEVFKLDYEKENGYTDTIKRLCQIVDNAKEVTNEYGYSNINFLLIGEYDNLIIDVEEV